MKKFLLVPLLIVFIFSDSDGQNIGNLLKKVKPGKKTESAESGGNQPGNTSSKPANNSDDKKAAIPAILIKPDGTKKTIKINNIPAFGKRVFSVSSKNEICWLDTDTWDLYTEGKKVGTFKKGNVHPRDIAIIACSDLSKSVLYDRMGTLYFLNGHVEKAGAVYPFLTSANGKQYIIWIKQSGENILKGSIELK